METRPPDRFRFDLDLIAPDALDSRAREREWKRIVSHFLPRLREYFAHRIRNDDELDEVLSFVLRQAIRHLHLVGHPDAAWNWMRTTGSNQIKQMERSAFREKQRNIAFGAEQAHLDSHIVVPEEGDLVGTSHGVEITTEGKMLEARIAQLSAEESELFGMIVDGGKNHNEVASALQISPQASRKRYSRIVSFLRTGKRASA